MRRTFLRRIFRDISDVITDMNKTFTNFATKVLSLSKSLLALASYIMIQIIEVIQY